MIANIEAERSLLGCVLLEGDLIKEIGLAPEHYSLPKHQEIYRAMKQLEKKEIPIDLVTVTETLGKKAEQIGIEYLTDLGGHVPSTDAFKTYEQYVMDAWKLRMADRVTKQLQSRIQEKDVAIISETIQELSRIDESGLAQEFNLKDTLSDLYEEMERMSQEKRDITGISTGFKDLDRLTLGLQNEELLIMGARPSIGKTALALNMAWHATKDAVSTVFSLEMSKKLLLKRLFSFIGNIDGAKIKNPKLFKEDDWDRLTHAIGNIYQRSLLIYDKPSITVQEIRSTLRKNKRKYPDQPHVCFIDYLTLIKGSNRQNRTEEVGEIARELKRIALDLQMPIVCLAQLSRGVEQRQNKQPMMSDLRDSGEIEQHADTIMFLYRDDYYNSETEKKNIVEVNIAKQRNGPVGMVELLFLKEYSKFLDLERR